MGRTLLNDDALADYVFSLGAREHPVQIRCRNETNTMGWEKAMQIGPDQGAFLAMLVNLIGAKRTIEVGVFTGYSALSVALALPSDGRVIACDVSEEWTAKARGYWEEAGVTLKIDLRLAPATETLKALLEGGGAGQYDFAFIDADKTGYDSYYEYCLELLRPGGLIAIDNVLWNGNVIKSNADDEDTVAIRAINEKVHSDERVDPCLVSIGDGVMLARKR